MGSEDEGNEKLKPSKVAQKQQKKISERVFHISFIGGGPPRKTDPKEDNYSKRQIDRPGGSLSL